MTDDRRFALQDLAEQQQADATAALIAVKHLHDAVPTLIGVDALEHRIRTMMAQAKHFVAMLREDGEPR